MDMIPLLTVKEATKINAVASILSGAEYSTVISICITSECGSCQIRTSSGPAISFPHHVQWVGRFRVALAGMGTNLSGHPLDK